jgi:hypothetical protein
MAASAFASAVSLAARSGNRATIPAGHDMRPVSAARCRGRTLHEARRRPKLRRSLLAEACERAGAARTNGHAVDRLGRSVLCDGPKEKDRPGWGRGRQIPACAGVCLSALAAPGGPCTLRPGALPVRSLRGQGARARRAAGAREGTAFCPAQAGKGGIFISMAMPANGPACWACRAFLFFVGFAVDAPILVGVAVIQRQRCYGV